MKILFSVVVIVASVVLVTWISKAPPGKNTPPNSSSTKQLTWQDIIVGQGEETTAGDSVRVDYVGILENGEEFDSSINRGKPFEFTLGAGQVIKGWDQGVEGMKVGGKRKLTIPPELGYGSQPTGKIPANSTLIFEVNLLAIIKQ